MYNSLINFRYLTEADLKLMHHWLNQEIVSKWYGKRSYTFEEVKEKYMKYINFEKPTHAFIILYDNKAIGYIQTYRIDNYKDYEKSIQSEGINACGVDLFIGEEDYIHKGYGKLIISKFLKEKAFMLTNTEICIIGPETKNTVAIKTYEKVGFRFWKLVNTDEEDEYLMKLKKDELLI